MMAFYLHNFSFKSETYLCVYGIEIFSGKNGRIGNCSFDL